MVPGPTRVSLVIYLIRHGETASNEQRVVQRSDTPLSARGALQAERLAARLADVGLVEPMILFRLVWAAVLGFFLFSEIPGIEVWIGGALIVGATSFVARTERRSSPAK